jgi:mono/diheme cytochrome c family protein
LVASALVVGSAVAASITGFTPSSGIENIANACVGSRITITGAGFAQDSQGNPVAVTGVSFNGTPAASFAVGSDTMLYATVPASATTGPISIATSAGTVTSTAPFYVFRCAGFSPGGPVGGTPGSSASTVPTVTGFSPAQGTVGSKITISGSAFGNVIEVQIGGLAAKFTAVSKSMISATVPAGARTGKIAVTAPPDWIAKSAAKFTVIGANGKPITSPPPHPTTTPSQSTKPATTPTPGMSKPTTPSTPSFPLGDPSAGASVFASAGCATCHTLTAAGSTGTAGPNLDALQPSVAVIENQVEYGGDHMPAYGSTLTPQQIANLAAYVYQSTQRPA